jgi:hypothetical protein
VIYLMTAERVMTMDDIPALKATARGDQYAHIEARLIDEYGPRRGAVRHVIAEERGRFADARIHAFVPILVERSVRTRLGTPARRIHRRP